jgi:hypothetical protein
MSDNPYSPAICAALASPPYIKPCMDVAPRARAAVMDSNEDLFILLPDGSNKTIIFMLFSIK